MVVEEVEEENVVELELVEHVVEDYNVKENTKEENKELDQQQE